MSHVRQQIREAAATLLTGLTTTAARVYQSRIYTLRDTDLPCLLINADDEQDVTLGLNEYAAQERSLQLSIRCVSKQVADLDDKLDTMLAEVETALGNQTLGGKAKTLQLESIAIEMSDELEKPVGIATAVFRITYYTATGTPGTSL
jgi:hypothetical protein